MAHSWSRRSATTDRVKPGSERVDTYETERDPPTGPSTTGDPPMNLLDAWHYLQARLDLDRDERGASLVEYALLVALIAVVCIAAITILGNNASTKFSEVGGSIGGS
jgi:pilus assembly protein Flp/PilA